MKSGKKLEVSADSAVDRYVDILQNDLLKDEKAINENVEFRQIIDLGESKATNLVNVKAQFEEKTGNIISGSLVHYHEEKRAMDERREFFIREDLGEWEKIAFASAYFRSGQFAMNPYITSEEAKKDADYPTLPHWFHITRLLVAEKLQPVLGFTESVGYEMKAEMKSALDSMRSDPQIVEQVKIYGICKVEDAKLQANLVKEVAKAAAGGGRPIRNKGDAMRWIEEYKGKEAAGGGSFTKLPKALQAAYKDYTTMQALITTITPGPGKPAPEARLQAFYKEMRQWRDSYKGSHGRGRFFTAASPVYNLWAKVKDAAKKEEKIEFKAGG